MDDLKKWQMALLGGQMLFVAFGALVLVPILTGLDPAVALFTAGVGTLIFQLVTKRQVPVFLASSFAFIAPIIYGTQTWGIAATMSGLVAAGVLYMILSACIAWRGQAFIHRLLPPVVVGPVIMVIGLGLAPVAVHMAMGQTGDGAVQLVDQADALIVAAISLFVTIGVSVWAKGLFRLLPILSGIIAGYLAAIAYGMVDFEAVKAAPWFAVPSFTMPEWNWQAVLYILPIAIAPAVEHIGDVTAISAVANKDYLKKPGLHRTMLGDGLATSAAAMMGGPPNTTYSEVSGAVALTKVFNPVVMTWAAVFAIVLSFCGKLGAALSTIPVPVMGGILVLLFGTIAAIGMSSLVKAQVDLTEPRNMVIVAVTLVFGIGGMALQVGDLMLKGIGLAAIAAILLNLLLPKKLGE
ncbi:uracil-xanthine permease family protein [Litoribacillus peritrichatus]|uniref:Uracil-xanthine permease family protein n=1 Tax=Litoribacillus peritrichatus TaxID=718191 RepID=A0ABP7MNE7_9GAMM